MTARIAGLSGKVHSLLISILLLSVHLSATTYFVDSASAGGDGLSWATAKSSLSSALTASTTGDDIILKYGSYTVSSVISFTSDRRITSDDGTASGWDDANPDSSLCIISGAGSNRLFNVRTTGVTSATVFRGIKFTNGNGSSEADWDNAGGAMAIYDGASPVIENCWFADNTANTVTVNFQSSGGAIFTRGSGTNPFLRNNYFSGNVASYQNNSAVGGAIYVDLGSLPIIHANIFEGNMGGNSAGDDLDYASKGGALHVHDSSPLVTANIFRANYAQRRTTPFANAEWGVIALGGAISVGTNGSPKIYNNLFIGNTALYCPGDSYTGQASVASGGAISSLGPARIINNTFSGNTACSMYAYNASQGAGALNYSSRYTVISNNIFDDNTTNSEACIKGGSGGETITISNNLFHNSSPEYVSMGVLVSENEVLADPLFTNTVGADYSLQAASPAIDAGAAIADTSGLSRDFSGNPRPKNYINDMGAYEFQVDDPPRITSPDSVSATEDVFFSYRIIAEDSDNAAVTITVDSMAGWLAFDADSVFGTPTEAIPDTSFRIIASDGSLYDTLIVSVSVIAVNDAPEISSIADQSILQNASTGDLPFTISDAEMAASDLALAVSSSNTTLVPEANITLGGSGGDRTVGVTPAAGETGAATISITVSDGELSASSIFVLSVTVPNSAPVFAHGTVPGATEDQPFEFAFSVSDPDGDAVTLAETLVPAWLSLSTTAAGITTVAGSGDSYSDYYRGDGGPAVNGRLKSPTDVAVGPNGEIYIADENAYRIRRVGTDGIITTYAGTGVGTSTGDGGLATAATLRYPTAIAVDDSGNLYISEYYGHKIRRVGTDGIITTIAGTGSNGFSGDGGPATSAALYYPRGLTFDSAGNLYFTDSGNQRIRKIDTSGTITTVAGNGGRGFSGDNGAATSAMLYSPYDVEVDNGGNLYIADYGNNRIRIVDSSGIISTHAGTGTAGFSGDGGLAVNAQLNFPVSVLVDGAGNLLVSDQRNNRIRKIAPSGMITTIAGDGSFAFGGDGGDPLLASLKYPSGLALANGDLLIGDFVNMRVRKVSPEGNSLAGTPGDNDTGVQPVILTASDGQDQATLEIDISVTGVNDPPAITSAPAATATEDFYFVYRAGASDPDGDDLSWNFSSLPSWLSAVADSVFGTPDFRSTDTLFTAVVSDGELSDTLNISITVNQVNDTPVITSPLTASATEDLLFTYSALASDEENDPIAFSFSDFPAWLTAVGDSIYGTPLEGSADSSFRIIASDGNTSDTAVVELNFIPVNDPPIITSSSSPGATEDELFIYIPAANDVDSETLTWQLSGLSDWLTVSGDTISGTAGEGILAGSFTCIVSDGELTDTLAVTVTVTAVNDPPLITSSATAEAYEDLRFVFRAAATDPEEDPVTFSFSEYPGWLTAAGDSIFGTPREGSIDTSFRIIASDGELFDTSLVALTVIPVNDPPVIAAVDTLEATEDSFFAYRLSASDPESDTLAWSYGGLPDWLTAAGDSLSGTPLEGDGNQVILAIASDGELADSIEILITVTAVNDPPGDFSLEAPADQAVIAITAGNMEDLLVLSWTAANDEEGAPVTYALVLSDGLEIITGGAVTDTSVSWTYGDLSEALGDSASVTGTWTITATDSIHQVTAANGPFTLSIDKSALAIGDGLLVPDKFALHQNYPNPFNPSTRIGYDLPVQAFVRISVYDLQGRLARTLVNGHEEAGYRSVIWDGREYHGRQAASGVYLLTIEAGEFIARRKMLLIK